MSETFQLFRLSLLDRKQADLFDRLAHMNRKDYIEHVFSEDWHFKHYNSDFYYKSNHNRGPNGEIFGGVGRLVRREENLPPEQGFKETTHEGWKASIIIIDPTDHKDGQKLSIKIDTQVGAPGKLIEALAKVINYKYRHSPFSIFPEPLFDKNDFWDFARENEGQITSITFDFVAPNGPWGTSDDIKEAMREIREETRATNISQRYQNNDGLDLNSPIVKSSVEYASSGGGSIRAKTRKRKKYNSTDSRKIATIDEEIGLDENSSNLSKDVIDKVLGR